MIIVFSRPTYAVKYVFEKGLNNNFTSAEEIVQPDYFQYLYGMISQGETVADFYKFTLKETQPDFIIRLLVSEKENQRQFQPTLVFVDANSRDTIDNLPIYFPPDLKGKVYVWKENGNLIDNYAGKLVSGVVFSKNLSAGTYFLVVFDPQGRGGRYVVNIGAKLPTDTWQDKISSLFNLLRIKLFLY